LTESILLAIGGAGRRVGGGGGCGAAAAGPCISQRAFSADQHKTVVAGAGFRFRLGVGHGIIFGAAPAWFATRTDPVDALRGSGRGTSDRSSVARKALLLVQAAFSVVLVAGATMLGRSLNKLEHQDSDIRCQGGWWWKCTIRRRLTATRS